VDLPIVCNDKRDANRDSLGTLNGSGARVPYFAEVGRVCDLAESRIFHRRDRCSWVHRCVRIRAQCVAGAR